MGKSQELITRIQKHLIGQESFVEKVVPYISLFNAELSPDGRPAGIFLLTGPTGSGKTRSVESLAAALHGSPKMMLRIDCGEFQLDHEVAKLVGAPPGYLGHRETNPILTQTKLQGVASEKMPLSLVLLDEFEKASTAMQRIMLAVFDKAQLRLGDNSVVNFQHTMIFMTTNLGVTEMIRADKPMGLGAFTPQPVASTGQIVGSVIGRRFAPEFRNRVDETIHFEKLTEREMKQILDMQLVEMNALIKARLGTKSFSVAVAPDSRSALIDKGFSKDMGARELKRTLFRQIWSVVGRMVEDEQVPTGAVVMFRGRGLKVSVVVNGQDITRRLRTA